MLRMLEGYCSEGLYFFRGLKKSRICNTTIMNNFYCDLKSRKLIFGHNVQSQGNDMGKPALLVANIGKGVVDKKPGDL